MSKALFTKHTSFKTAFMSAMQDGATFFMRKSDGKVTEVTDPAKAIANLSQKSIAELVVRFADGEKADIEFTKETNAKGKPVVDYSSSSVSTQLDKYFGSYFAC